MLTPRLRLALSVSLCSGEAVAHDGLRHMKPAASRRRPLGAPCCVAGAGLPTTEPALPAFTCVGCVQHRHEPRVCAAPNARARRAKRA